MHRVAIVCSHPIQYLSPWFRRLAQHPRLDVTVLYGDDHGLAAGFDPEFGRVVHWNVDLGSGYRFVLLKNRALRPGVGRFFGIVNTELFTLLSPQRFDAVLIQGWNYALYPLALAAARARGLPVLMRCESTPRDDAATIRGAFSRLRGALRNELLRKYLGQCAAGLAVSAKNRRLLIELGMPPSRIFFSPYAVEGARFALPVLSREAAALAWRQRLGVPGRVPLLLFVGKLIPIKAPELLLDAYFALRRRGVFAHLCFCGDGELRPRLEALSQRDAGVSFTGFVDQAELPALYAAADALVLPSFRETFGVVVAEAMHAGLPVVASDGVGCAEDLVKPPSGLCFSTGDGAGLLACLQVLCEGPQAEERRAAMAAAARARIAGWTYAESTQGLLDALDCIGSLIPSVR